MLGTAREHWTVDVTELIVRDRGSLRTLTAAYRRLLRHGRRMTLEGAAPELRQALTRDAAGQSSPAFRDGQPDTMTNPAEPTAED